jgi:hypothetical protein
VLLLNMFPHPGEHPDIDQALAAAERQFEELAA